VAQQIAVNLGDRREAARANWRQALALFTAIEDPNAARVVAWLAELD
jgi:hypothetical protein